jgi:hypothetical protein
VITVDEIFLYLPWIIATAAVLLLILMYFRGAKRRHLMPVLTKNGFELAKTIRDMSENCTPEELLMFSDTLYRLFYTVSDISGVSVENLPHIQDVYELEKSLKAGKKKDVR